MREVNICLSSPYSDSFSLPSNYLNIHKLFITNHAENLKILFHFFPHTTHMRNSESFDFVRE